MKFDMHCHTKAGSIDSKIPLDQYIELLKAQGFDGMLVTDHAALDCIVNGKKHKNQTRKTILSFSKG